MKATIKINEDLLKQAKKRATEEGRSLASLVKDGLTLILAKPTANCRKRVELLISKATGGVLPGINLNRSSDLEEAMNVL